MSTSSIFLCALHFRPIPSIDSPCMLSFVFAFCFFKRTLFYTTYSKPAPCGVWDKAAVFISRLSRGGCCHHMAKSFQSHDKRLILSFHSAVLCFKASSSIFVIQTHRHCYRRRGPCHKWFCLLFHPEGGGR